MKRWLSAVAAAGVMAVTLTGCGGSSDVTAKGAKALKPYVEALRSAAAGTSQSKVDTAVTRLQTEVHKEVQLGHITSSRGSAIEDAATRLQADFENVQTSSSPTDTTSETPTTAPPTTQQPPTTGPPATTQPPPPTTPSHPDNTVTVSVKPPGPGGGSSSP